MVKKEIFTDLLIIVSEETGVAPELIASSVKREEVVDARYILVYILNIRGYYASMIAPLIFHKKRSVNYMISNFENRLNVSPLMAICYERICLRLAGKDRAIIEQ